MDKDKKTTTPPVAIDYILFFLIFFGISGVFGFGYELYNHMSRMPHMEAEACVGSIFTPKYFDNKEAEFNYCVDRQTEAKKHYVVKNSFYLILSLSSCFIGFYGSKQREKISKK